MKNQFTAEEIEMDIKKLKYNKSHRTDEISAEHIRYGPAEELPEIIKQILNETAKTGAYIEEISILTPLQKHLPNFRHIILLSFLRNILAILMIKRITGRTLQCIPKTSIPKIAYQSGRNTTEHVFVIKLLAS